MKKCLILLSCNLIFLIMNLFSYTVVTLPYELKSAYIGSKYEITGEDPDKTFDIMISDNELDKFIAKGAIVKFNMSDQLKNIPGYNNYSSLLAILQILEANNPGIVKLYNLGPSTGKLYYQQGNNNYQYYQHDIWAVKVSDNVLLNEDEPRFYFAGNHHAREPISTEVVLSILQYLINNYNSNPSITELVNNNEIWFIPSVNPDGTKIVLDPVNNYGDLNWRKNIRDNDGNNNITMSNYPYYPDGVDLERNYGYKWGLDGSSGVYTDQTYRGPAPFSEVESQYMKNLFDEKKFVAGIFYHSYSELVLYPFGYSANAYVPDIQALSNLGIELASRIPSITGTGHYTAQSANALYPVSGGHIDYNYANHRTFSYVIELGKEFIPPMNVVQQICQDNLNAAIYLLNRVKYSCVTGLITDSVTKQPISAKVIIKELDTDLTEINTQTNIPETGRYYRLLMPGNYTLRIEKYGYLPKEYSITINSQSQTIQNVELEPDIIQTYHGALYDARTGLALSGVTISFKHSNDNGNVINTTTEANGNFSVNLYQGNYIVKILGNNIANLEYNINFSSNIFEYFVLYTYSFVDYDNMTDMPGIYTVEGDWQWGIPVSNFGVHSYNKCWGTKLSTGLYSNGLYSKLKIENLTNSPLASGAKLYFYHRYDIKGPYDGGNVKISTDGGMNFNVLQPKNGYPDICSNINMENQGIFSGSNGKWELVEIDLSNYAGTMPIIRFDFIANMYGNGIGWYIDDIFLYNPTNVGIENNINYSEIIAYPNPANFSSGINFKLNGIKEKTELEIFNIKGELVKTLNINEKINEIHWDIKDKKGNEVGSGIYFYRVKNYNNQKLNKFLLLR